MNSFDVFDTLIARRFITTHSVWEQMGKEFNLPNFLTDRPKPDDGTRSFEGIYQSMVDWLYIPAELKEPLMLREIELEIENCYGIKENIDKVQEGDFLITDMYLHCSTILQMVRTAGLEKQVSIYQSNADKGNGSVWQQLMPNPPQLHLGDNHHTDFFRPTSYGIKSQIYEGSKLTNKEQELSNIGLKNLALLVRETRLRNNVQQHKEYFNLSCQTNLPFLFVISERLRRNVGNRPIVFLGRDCQLLWKVYNLFYATAYYLPFSRKVAYTQPNLAAEYLKLNMPYNGILVDISSTSETWTHLSQYGSFDIKAVIYSDSQYRSNVPENFSYITRNSICGQTNLVLEIMNCADHGLLNSLTHLGNKLINGNYLEPELSKDLISVIHKPVNTLPSLSKFYRNSIKAELAAIDDSTLERVFNKLSEEISSNINLLINLKEFKNKEDEYHQSILEIRKQLNEKNN